jgi:hypothetical protein
MRVTRAGMTRPLAVRHGAKLLEIRETDVSVGTRAPAGGEISLAGSCVEWDVVACLTLLVLRTGGNSWLVGVTGHMATSTTSGCYFHAVM